MKYIRTKDNIVKHPHPNAEVFTFRYEIIKQADAIEELCDEFVCLENKMTFHNLETITSSCNLKHLTIYGAIWTDKGLIYVAKMNEKGELELL